MNKEGYPLKTSFSTYNKKEYNASWVKKKIKYEKVRKPEEQIRNHAVDLIALLKNEDQLE